jgi:hypothetical protein
MPVHLEGESVSLGEAAMRGLAEVHLKRNGGIFIVWVEINGTIMQPQNPRVKSFAPAGLPFTDNKYETISIYCGLVRVAGRP